MRSGPAFAPSDGVLSRAGRARVESGPGLERQLAGNRRMAASLVRAMQAEIECVQRSPEPARGLGELRAELDRMDRRADPVDAECDDWCQSRGLVLALDPAQDPALTSTEARLALAESELGQLRTARARDREQMELALERERQTRAIHERAVAAEARAERSEAGMRQLGLVVDQILEASNRAIGLNHSEQGGAGTTASALEFASAGLRADRAVVMAAVECNGSALQFAAPALKDDREVVEAAIRDDPAAVAFASDQLKAELRPESACQAEQMVQARMEGSVSKEIQDAIKAGLVATQLRGAVSEQTQNAIKAGLVRTQLEGAVSEQTQNAIKAGLVRTQLEGAVSDENQSLGAGDHTTAPAAFDPLDTMFEDWYQSQQASGGQWFGGQPNSSEASGAAWFGGHSSPTPPPAQPVPASTGSNWFSGPAPEAPAGRLSSLVASLRSAGHEWQKVRHLHRANSQITEQLVEAYRRQDELDSDQPGEEALVVCRDGQLDRALLSDLEPEEAELDGLWRQAGSSLAGTLKQIQALNDRHTDRAEQVRALLTEQEMSTFSNPVLLAVGGLSRAARMASLGPS